MNKEFYDRLTAIVSVENVLLDEPMKKHTTFRVGGNADIFVCPKIDQVSKIVALAKEYEIPITIIGNGSNLLVGDQGIRGLVLAIAKNAEYIRWEEVEDSKMRLHVGAGTLLSKVASEAAKRSLTGMEFAAGIPGSMGGAVVMNAGAYGGEIKDIIVRATVLTPEGEVLELSKEDLELSYRHSCVPDKDYIVLEAVLDLSLGEEDKIRAMMDDFKNRRIEKQPLEYPSAGSTFKRPEGYFAGKLIEDAGLRGYTVGGAQVSEKHCGFVINRGDATAADVLQLIEDVQKKVYDVFQVQMEPEVKMMGEF